MSQAGPVAPEGHPVHFSLSRSQQTALWCQDGVRWGLRANNDARWEPVLPSPMELPEEAAEYTVPTCCREE